MSLGKKHYFILFYAWVIFLCVCVCVCVCACVCICVYTTSSKNRVIAILFLGTVCCLVAKSCVTLVTSWTVPNQDLLSMGLPRQEYWSGLSFPSPEHLPDSVITHASPALIGGFYSDEPPGKIKLSLKNYIQKDTYTPVISATLFIIVKT